MENETAMNFVVALTDLFKVGGPWTLLAVACWVIRYQYNESKTERVAAAKEKQDLNDRLLNIVKEQTTVIVQNNENQKLMIKAMEAR